LIAVGAPMALDLIVSQCNHLPPLHKDVIVTTVCFFNGTDRPADMQAKFEKYT